MNPLRRITFWLLCMMLLPGLSSCDRRRRAEAPTRYPQNYAPPGQYRPNAYPPGQYRPGSYPPRTYAPPTPAPYPPAPPLAHPTPPPTATTPLPPPTATIPIPPIPSNLPPTQLDPINVSNVGFMRQRAHAVLSELVAALPPNQKALVEGIPLVVEDEVGEVNAFAACIDGKALMAISDGLMEIQTQMARARATDEIFGSKKFDQYVQHIAKNQRPKQAIVKPSAGFFHPSQDLDLRKVQRQHQLFDEELAFVLGHELAHHYLGHTGCVGRAGAGISPQDIGRALSNAVPVFNQPNEIAADTSGVNNLLTTGSRRTAYKWTERGSLLTLNFFLALRKMTPAEAVLFGFQSSHPHPAFRIPIVQQTAANWRASGGRPFRFPFPLPGLGG